MHHSRKYHLMCVGFGILTAVMAALGAGLWALIPAAGCAITCVQMIVGMIRGAKSPPEAFG
jgi:hypothetical protein